MDENKWMQGAKFYVNQQKERRGSNLTKCILGKQPECVYKVCSGYLFQPCLLSTFHHCQSLNDVIPGHSASVSETVQGRLSSEIHQYVFVSLAVSRSLGFVEPRRLAERWATLILCHSQSLILKEIFWLLEFWRR